MQLNQQRSQPNLIREPPTNLNTDLYLQKIIPPPQKIEEEEQPEELADGYKRPGIEYYKEFLEYEKRMNQKHKMSKQQQRLLEEPVDDDM